METTKGIFEQMYNASAELIKSGKKPFVKNQIKRKFQSAIDDADMKIIDLESANKAEYENFAKNPEDFKLETIVENIQLIEQYKLTRGLLVSEYEKVFAKKPKIASEED